MSDSNNVRSFTDQELLERFKNLASFRYFPENYWFLGVRSAETEGDDKFHDKGYLFHGKEFVKVWKITTNAGKSGLKYPVNPHGCAVLKSDVIFYDAWGFGMHKQKVQAYVQVKNVMVYRDADRDDYAEEQGALESGLFGINIHPSSYIKGSPMEREFIGPWSVGCLVFAVRKDFDEFMRITDRQPLLTGCVLKEF